ncbi:tandem-95 repeat protein [Candidatus Jorgensenbacteria bacterium]|nr:tandem-95 repeat protein [Candidatus Jorgensenbacteria bacterium]
MTKKSSFDFCKTHSLGSKILSIFTIAMLVGITTPLNAIAAPGYLMGSVAAQVTGALQLSISGSASGNPVVGTDTQQFVTIDWGETISGSPVRETFDVMTDSHFTTISAYNKKNLTSFSTSWTPISHTYTSVGTKTIRVKVHHQGWNGVGEGDSSEFTADVFIPPAALSVIVHTIGGSLTSSNFTVNVSGVNASPTSFNGSESGTIVSLDPGVYSVNEVSQSQYNTVTTENCSGSIGSGESKTCTLTNTFITNQSPILNPIGNQIATELVALSLTATASDAENDPLTFSIANSPANSIFDTNSGVFAWTPTETQGPNVYTVTIGVTDGTSSDFEIFDITVNEINVAPVASDALVSTHSNTPKTITFVATDSDVPTQTLTFSIDTPPAHGTLSEIVGDQVTYTPEENYLGSDLFKFKANDGITDSNVGTVNITVNNDAPTLNPIPDQIAIELVALNLVGGTNIVATDPNSDPLTFSLGVAPSIATIDPSTGDFSWMPGETDGPGTYPVTVVVSDGVLSDSQSFTINVNEVNETPIANDDDSITTDEDTSVLITLSGSDADIPTQTLIFSIDTPPAHGTLSEIVGDQVTYTPNTDYNGSDSFTFVVYDGVVNSTPGTIDIGVDPINDVPAITLNGSSTINLLIEDPFIDPGAIASDVENGDLTGSIVVGGDTVNTNTIGVYGITYNVADLDGAPASEVMRTVNVLAKPLPVITGDTAVTIGETTSTIGWTTDIPATSRVIFDTTSHPELGDGQCPSPLEFFNCYGYGTSTQEFDATSTVTNHLISLDNLVASTTYYYRVISGPSPEVVGDEHSFTTTGGNTSGDGGGGGSTGGGETGGGGSTGGGESSGGGGGGGGGSVEIFTNPLSSSGSNTGSGGGGSANGDIQSQINSLQSTLNSLVADLNSYASSQNQNEVTSGGNESVALAPTNAEPPVTEPTPETPASPPVVAEEAAEPSLFAALLGSGINLILLAIILAIALLIILFVRKRKNS